MGEVKRFCPRLTVDQFGTIIHFLRGTTFTKALQPPLESLFARLRGSAKFAMTTDELMALTRGETEP